LQKEVEKLKAETEELKKSKSHLDGQAFQLRMDLKETREENTKLKIELERQSDSIHKLEKVGFSLHTL
jgi:predicted nuclease with TOPRIM domain